jgi:transposase
MREYRLLLSDYDRRMSVDRPGFDIGPTSCGGSSHVTPFRVPRRTASAGGADGREVRPNYESDWAAITAVAQKLGIGTADTLRKRVRQAQVATGQRAGVSTDESAELKRMRRENAELLRRTGS